MLLCACIVHARLGHLQINEVTFKTNEKFMERSVTRPFFNIRKKLTLFKKLRVKLRVTFLKLFVKEYRKIELVGRSVS